VKKLFSLVKPHRTVPRVPWTANHRWDLGITRVAVLILGLAAFGIGEALLIQSHIGNAPWAVLAQGISLHSPLNIGVATIVIGAVVLLFWLPLGERPGFGTLANILVLGLFLEWGVLNIPASENNFALSLFMVLLGIGVIGVGSSLYITTGLGPGPRDGLMTALHQKTGIRVARVRLCIEIAALSVGALLGGRVGLGTALFALLIGNSVAVAFTVMDRLANR
jgi:uncharacterized membrane protein YczE